MIELPELRITLLSPLLQNAHGYILIPLAGTRYLFSYYLFIFLPIVTETEPVTFLFKIFERFFFPIALGIYFQLLTSELICEWTFLHLQTSVHNILPHPSPSK